MYRCNNCSVHRQVQGIVLILVCQFLAQPLPTSETHLPNGCAQGTFSRIDWRVVLIKKDYVRIALLILVVLLHAHKYDCICSFGQKYVYLWKFVN